VLALETVPALEARDSPLFFGISFSGVGGPLKAPCKIFRIRPVGSLSVFFMSASDDGMSDSMRAHIQYIMDERVPHIDDSNFSKEERDHVDSILLLLNSLNSFIEAFRADIELFDYAESHADLKMRWAPIACRDAAMTIYNFQDAIDHIFKAFKRCPPLKTLARERALRAAVGRAGAAFPTAEKMRNVTAHPVGHIGTAKARRDNSLRGSPVIVQNSWSGRKVMHSKEGREVSFEISETTVQTLMTLRNGVFKVFS